MNHKYIDQAAIENIKSLNTEPGDDLVGEIAKLFCETMPKKINEMRSALQKNNMTELKALAHNVKSTCSNMGAREMTRLAEQLEHESSRDLVVVEKLLSSLENEFKLAEEELRQYVS